MSIYSRRDDAVYVLLIGGLLLVVALATGFRPVEVGADTRLYSQLYQELLDGEESLYKLDVIYNATAEFFSAVGLSHGLFFSFVSSLSLFFFYSSLFKFNAYFQQSDVDAGLFIYGLLFLLCSPVFFSAQVNVIRQGVSCLALIYFYSCFLSGRYGFLFFFSAVIALGFHSSSILFVGVAVGLIFSYSCVLIFVLILAFAYSLGVSESLVRAFSTLSNFDIYSKVVEYGAMEGYRAGIRLDFAAFSCVLGLFLDLLSRLFLSVTQRTLFQGCLKIYWLFLIPFFIFGFGAFSDRLLLNAWLFFSVLIGVIFSQAHFFECIPRVLSFFVFCLAVIVYAMLAQGGGLFLSDLLS
ncbi:EpsG family protein [Pseudomonas cavernae]|uniref:EpsG family protein n=1 Tax=Pseudomonas cavernae TaxID=2320867 RepID=UPI0013C4E8BA|nr:EpsG family protein [Pseudomonas cavernae]